MRVPPLWTHVYVRSANVSWSGHCQLTTIEGDALDREVVTILQAKCVMCHDSLGTTATSHVDNLLDLPELAGMLDLRDRDYVDELLLGGVEEHGVREPRMPKQKFGSVEWNGPLSQTQKQTLLRWLQRGGPSAAWKQPKVKPRAVISFVEEDQMIADDLLRLDDVQRKDTVYLSFASLWNDPKLALNDLEQFRRGLVFALNSVSRAKSSARD